MVRTANATTNRILGRGFMQGLLAAATGCPVRANVGVLAPRRQVLTTRAGFVRLDAGPGRRQRPWNGHPLEDSHPATSRRARPLAPPMLGLRPSGGSFRP